MTLQKSVLNPHQKTWTKITENVLSFFFSFLLEDRAYALMHSVHVSVRPFEFLAAKSKFKKNIFSRESSLVLVSTSCQDGATLQSSSMHVNLHQKHRWGQARGSCIFPHYSSTNTGSLFSASLA